MSDPFDTGKGRRSRYQAACDVQPQPGENPAHARIRALKERMFNPPPKVERPQRVAPRFTTQYAIDWGRAQGWKLLDRENYDHRLKRHKDLMLGTDAMFEGPEGIVLVQGAGRYERAEHRRRFDERGGESRAERLRVKVVYVEFERGEPEPVLTEWWA